MSPTVTKFPKLPKFILFVKKHVPGDQEGLFKLAIQLRKFLFITL
jgi:hypothetical protein